MSRSAFDATRFTATGPHAYTNSPAAPSATSPRWALNSGSQQQQSSKGGATQPKETPKQKVERLRAEARAARIAKSSSPIDRALAKGRTWADRAHRAAVVSLLAVSGVAGVLTVYSMCSLVLHNRRQQALWLDRELQKLLDAKKAYIAGTATPEQLEVLANEKAGDEEKRRKEEAKKDGVLYKTKQLLFGGLKNEDAAASTESPGLDEFSNGKLGVLDAVNAKRADDMRPAMENTFSKESASDLGNSGESTGSEAKRSWTSWITGR
ncbi:hypothetical protein AJ80_03274 [Polytolypa hystricis UAMH7299]|uniref:Cytochrome oxidase c assembly-domain-containing protein n=1 Tax=Polytolypa hystricis (strain UAMH7299) TaxID=1447883 RepID=A0A2B7YL79_POLH7|nr:hypothetical protein AJ80_03274 [Polytolypa hystricis UAMH7299]